jgi:hypothetical protein
VNLHLHDLSDESVISILSGGSIDCERQSLSTHCQTVAVGVHSAEARMESGSSFAESWNVEETEVESVVKEGR